MAVVIEKFLRGKFDDPERCEDGYVISDAFLAVLDGETDKTGLELAGRSGGRFAANVLCDGVRDLPPSCNCDEAIEALSDRLEAELAAFDFLTPDRRPGVAVLIYSVQRDEIWRVGDVRCLIDGSPRYEEKAIDKVASAARSAHLQALLLGGATVQSLSADDPGRQMILPLLQEQWRFRNLERREPLAFGAIDGRPVPNHFRERLPVGPGRLVVVVSDGYPVPYGTLVESEDALKRSLDEDPLRIGNHAGTKGVGPGQTSFDDRTYLRFQT